MEIRSTFSLLSGAALVALSPTSALAQGAAPAPGDRPADPPASAEAPGGDAASPVEAAPTDAARAEGAASEPASPPPAVAPPEPPAAPEPESVQPAPRHVGPPEIQPAPLPAPTGAPVVKAEPLGLIPTGSFFSRLESRDGFYRLGVDRGRTLEGDLIAYRTRFGLRTAPLDIGGGTTASVQFTPQASGYWGILPSTLSDAELGLHEGYLRFERCWFGLDAGRFIMKYGDALVIGDVDWHQTGRSFDGLRSRFNLGAPGVGVDVFFTQVDEGVFEHPDDPGAGDAYFTGVYAQMGPALADQLALDVYSFAQIWPYTQNVLLDPDDPASLVASRQSAAQVTLGSRVKHRVGPVDLRAEAGVQVGHRPRPDERMSALAYQADAEVGVNAAEDRIRVGVEGLYASGDDPDTADRHEGWDPLYPTAHKWLGLSDIVGGRTNVYGGVLHLQAKVVESLALKLQGHVFFRPRHAPEVDDYAGAELDTGVVYTIGRGLRLRGMWARFWGHSHHYARGGAADFGEIELRYDF